MAIHRMVAGSLQVAKFGGFALYEIAPEGSNCELKLVPNANHRLSYTLRPSPRTRVLGLKH